MGMSDAREQPGFALETTEDWVPDLLTIASRRAPRIADAGIKGGWAGLYEVTPDHNAIIGESERVAASSTPRASRATGSSRVPPSARSCATSSWAGRRSWTSGR